MTTCLIEVESVMSQTIRYILILTVSFAAGFMPRGAMADDLKINGFWVEGLQVRDIAGYRIYFDQRGRELDREMSAVEAMRLSDFPQVETWYTQMAEGNADAALATADELAGKARVRWLKHWAQQARMLAADKAGKPSDVVAAYVALVTDTADVTFVVKPPLIAVAQADADMKRRLAGILDVAKRRTRGEDALAGLAALTKAATTGEAEAAAMVEEVKAAAAPTKALVPVPAGMDAKDQISQMLYRGQWSEALAATNDRLSKKELMLAMRLYQRGLAQLYLAKESETSDPTTRFAAYKTAGLSFMRAAIYFSSNSTYRGPALVETGYIHYKIGRLRVAQRLLEQARPLIDDETDPSYAERLETTLAAVNEALDS